MSITIDSQLEARHQATVAELQVAGQGLLEARGEREVAQREADRLRAVVESQRAKVGGFFSLFESISKPKNFITQVCYIFLILPLDFLKKRCLPTPFVYNFLFYFFFCVLFQL